MPITPDPAVNAYAPAALVAVLAAGLGSLAVALRAGAIRTIAAPSAWTQFRFGYPIYTLIFLAFDMEMIFMYPWTRVITTMGASAVIEMFSFLAVLLAGVTYAWREGALRWT